MTQTEFVKWVYPAAKKGEIHPAFVTAQAALETGWGKSAIGNNLFGITKGSSWNGKLQLVTTTEYFTTPNKRFPSPEQVLKVQALGNGKYKYKVKRLFRDYDTLEQCLEDHLSILKKKMYADAWPHRNDPREFARRIVDNTGARYATDPNYAQTMCSIIGTVEKIVNKEGL